MKKGEFGIFAGGICTEENVGHVLKALFLGGAKKIEVAPVFPEEPPLALNGAHALAAPKLAGLLPPPTGKRAMGVLHSLLQQHPIVTTKMRGAALKAAGMHPANIGVVQQALKAGYAKKGKRGELISLIQGQPAPEPTPEVEGEPQEPATMPKGRGARILYAMLKHNQTIASKELRKRLEKVGLHPGNSGVLLENAVVKGWARKGPFTGEYTSLIAETIRPTPATATAPKPAAAKDAMGRRKRRQDKNATAALAALQPFLKKGEPFRTAAVIEALEKQEFSRATVQRMLIRAEKEKLVSHPMPGLWQAI